MPLELKKIIEAIKAADAAVLDLQYQAVNGHTPATIFESIILEQIADRLADLAMLAGSLRCNPDIQYQRLREQEITA